MAKSFTGVVSSDRGDKTIVVTVQTHKTHPLYKKRYMVSKKFMAHDETNQAKQGDMVVITETRPLSARKRFKLDKIVEKAGVQHVEDASESLVASLQSPAKKQKTADKEPEAKA